MKVFLTGGSGFVGLNVAQHLLVRGDEVTLFSSSAPLPGAADELKALPGQLKVVAGDVTDGAGLKRALADSQATHLVHLAAITASLERDKRDPAQTFEVNLMGTLRALEAFRDLGLVRFVLASTGAVFGAESFPPDLVSEDRHLPSPVSIYDISKYAAERAALHLAGLWDLDVLAGRLPMVFGPWEYRTGLRDNMSALWNLCRLAREGGQAVVPVAGVQDWMYGPDAARALLALVDAPAPSHRLYHLGIEAPWGLAEWAGKLAARYPRFAYQTTARDEECTVAARGTLGRTAFNTARLRTDLGFRAEFPLDRAFEHYEAWLDSHPGVWA